VPCTQPRPSRHQVSPRPVPKIRRSSSPDDAPVQSPGYKPVSAPRASHAGGAALPFREVLREALRLADFADTLRPLDGLDIGHDVDAEVLCGAEVGNKKSRFPGISSLPKPSDGLEPSTPLYEEGPPVNSVVFVHRPVMADVVRVVAGERCSSLYRLLEGRT